MVAGEGMTGEMVHMAACSVSDARASSCGSEPRVASRSLDLVRGRAGAMPRKAGVMGVPGVMGLSEALEACDCNGAGPICAGDDGSTSCGTGMRAGGGKDNMEGRAMVGTDVGAVVAGRVGREYCRAVAPATDTGTIDGGPGLGRGGVDGARAEVAHGASGKAGKRICGTRGRASKAEGAERLSNMESGWQVAAAAAADAGVVLKDEDRGNGLAE